MADTYGESGSQIGEEAETGLPSEDVESPQEDLPPIPDRHTIHALGLNIEAYLEGRHEAFLPPEWRSWDRAAVYPLPQATAELYEISALTLVKGRSSEGHSKYIRRARKAYKQRCSARNPERLTNKVHVADTELNNIRLIKKEARSELADVRADIAKAGATLNDLYGLIKAGSYMILKGFVEGGEVNGEKVGPDEFTSITKGILTHLAKLGGVGEEDRKDAEGAVFEEAVRSTRKRLEDGTKVGLTVKGPEAEQ